MKPSLVWMLCACAVALPACAAAPKTVTIQDYIGVDWQRELVHYAFQFAPGEMTAPAARVTVVGGQAIPSQVSDVERHADGSVRSLTVWFYADVPAAVTKQFIELSTAAPRKIGIRLPSGGAQYDWPVPAQDVPGPIQTLLLPSGRTAGKGRFDVPFRVKSWQAEVTEDGPLFAEARVKYVFDTGYWTLSARVMDGCPMVLVEEEFDTGYSGQEWQEADRFYTLVLNGEGFRPTQAFYCGRTDKEHYHNLVKKHVQKALDHAATGHAKTSDGVEVSGYTLSLKQERDDYYMTAWPTWSPRCGVGIRFVEPGKDAVGFATVKTVRWRNPLSLRFRVGAKGELQACLPIQMYEQGWPSEGFGRYSPNATGKTLYVPENTGRRHYGIMLSPAEDELQNHIDSLIHLAVKLGSNPLDEVKDWVLDWPDPIADAQWAAESSEAGKTALELMRGWREIKRALGHYGMYSMWNHRSLTHIRYPRIQPVIDSPKDLTAEDRRELRRLCAYQAYALNSLEHFPWGVGSHLGNPNMTIMAMDARIKSSQLVGDHPMFQQWGRWTLDCTRDYIHRFTRESGAPYENPHYTLGVTVQGIAEVNKVLMETKIGDAFDSERFHRCMRFVFDWLSPPDPRFNGYRVVLPLGNCSYQSVPPAMAEMIVRYYKDRDPELAGQFQWCANQTLPDGKKLKVVKDIVPKLGSVYYEDYGVSFRHGFGTPHETLFHIMAGNCNGHYELETDQMCYTLYAKGQPINLHFGNGYFPIFNRPWLRNRVSIDHRREVSERNDAKTLAVAFTPEAEYMRAAKDIDRLDAGTTEYPPDYGSGKSDPIFLQPHEDIPLTTYYRQVLFLKDQDPKGPNYFILRDEFGGTPTKPTDLSLWFLANGMERKGDVFHYDGQCLVDMDVFVSEPADLEPETGKFGHRQQPYIRYTGFDPNYHPGGKRWEEQLFLRIKQPPGKGYLVVLYPRLKEGDPEAKFTRLDESAVKIETPLATDYAFLRPFAFRFKDDRVSFRGMGGAVRFYEGGKIAVVNCEGEAEFVVVGKTITGQGPFVATIEGGKVETKTFGKGAAVKVR